VPATRLAALARLIPLYSVDCEDGPAQLWADARVSHGSPKRERNACRFVGVGLVGLPVGATFVRFGSFSDCLWGSWVDGRVVVADSVGFVGLSSGRGRGNV
jgi:hypothetical protein